ncbi:MAG: thioredoxin family protein [Luteolibacter sp.]|uniref:thioredoxin family protein n=1 Tax=Luteolibacter sp. TaxID=1962973 RepID=UPI0032667A14
MIRYLTIPLALTLALGSCAKLGLGKSDKKEEPSPYGPTGIPPQLRANKGDGGTAVEAGGNIPAAPSPSMFTPSEDIVYTDPDNPDAAIPELATLLSAPKRGPWEDSETVAKQRSVREGKPLLIWFTDSQSSPMCKAISQELFATNDFGDWATENLVRLRVDSFVKITDQDMSIDDAKDRELRIVDYNNQLKKRYKIMGYPSLIVISPSGEVVGRYRGYKRGDAQFVWGQLKQAQAVSDASYKGWRTGMEKKGYREWSDRRDRKVFAKLVSYSKGELVLIEPDGGRARTKEASLSDKDKAWIAEQKKLRNLQ